MDPLTTIQNIWNVIKYLRGIGLKVKENYNERLQLCTHVGVILDVVRTEYKAGIPHNLYVRLSILETTLNMITDSVEEISRSSRLEQILWRNDIAKLIAKAYKAMDEAMAIMNLGIHIDIRQFQHESEIAHQQDTAHIREDLDLVLRTQRDILDALQVNLRIYPEAILAIHKRLEWQPDGAERKVLQAGLHALQRRSGPMKVIPDEYVITSLEIHILRARKLGQGGYSTVYEGNWKGARVAVKELTAGIPHTFIQAEVNIWKRLRHPHVLEFFGACSIAEPPFIVSAYKKNGHALDYLFYNPNANRRQLLHDASLGLVYLHSEGVIHGDLKATNVLVDENGHACLADFGGAKIRHYSATIISTVGEEQKSVGTLRWMSPETIREGTSNKQTDIYSFGMTIYEVFTGVPPFSNVHDIEFRRLICEDGKRPLRPEGLLEIGLTNQTWKLITQCWTQRPQDRCDAAHITRMLDDQVDGSKDKHPVAEQEHPDIILPDSALRSSNKPSTSEHVDSPAPDNLSFSQRFYKRWSEAQEQSLSQSLSRLKSQMLSQKRSSTQARALAPSLSPQPNTLAVLGEQRKSETRIAIRSPPRRNPPSNALVASQLESMSLSPSHILSQKQLSTQPHAQSSPLSSRPSTLAELGGQQKSGTRLDIRSSPRHNPPSNSVVTSHSQSQSQSQLQSQLQSRPLSESLSQSQSQAPVDPQQQSSPQSQSLPQQSQPPLKSRSLQQPSALIKLERRSKSETVVVQPKHSPLPSLLDPSSVRHRIKNSNGSSKQSSKHKDSTMSPPPLAPDGESAILAIPSTLLPGLGPSEAKPDAIPDAVTRHLDKALEKTLPMVPIKDTDIVVAIMGAAGSGKSAFINLVTEGYGLSRQSVTQDVETRSFSRPLLGKIFVLVDTPGLDSPNMSEADILKIIALFLETSYYQGHKLHGVIYMHRITDIRLGGTARRNFNMFLKLCGSESMKNVAIVTNMWNEITEERGAAHERELREDPDLFKPAIDRGAKMYRHDNTENSAQAILGAFLDSTPVPLLIQHELVVEKKVLMETSAGIELDHQLDELVRKQQSELKDVESDMAAALDAKDVESTRELDEERQRLKDSIARVDMDRQRIAREYMEKRETALTSTSCGG